MKTNSRHIISCTFAVGIVYRLLMSLQGIDHTDMGFCMTFYQNIFRHPEAMTFYFNYYLTGFFGGLWQTAFPQLGLLGFRLLETLTMSVAVWLIYLAFRPWMSSAKISAAAIVLSFLFPSFILTFHYNTLSFLLMAASIFAMAHWLLEDKGWWLLAAGVFIGISFFARIVNITMGALIVVPLLSGWLSKSRRPFTCALVYACGIIAGCILVGGLLVATGQLTYFKAGVSEAFGVFGGHETSHTSGNLFWVYLKSYINIGLQVFALFLIAVAYGYTTRLSFKVKVGMRAMLLAALFVLTATSQPYLSAIAGCTLLILPFMFNRLPGRILVYNNDASTEQAMLMLYVLLMAYLFPFGSDIGIPGIFHWCGGLLIIPASCCCAKLTRQWQIHLTGALALSVGLCMMWKMVVNTNSDDTPRTAATTVALPHTLNTMTSADKALQYKNIVNRIAQHAGHCRLLLIANQASELYYATSMLPFTGNTQMGTFTGNILIERLNQQQQFYQQLPVIVYLLRGFDTPDVPSMRQTLQPWMEEMNYRLNYSDNDLQIYTTSTLP